MSDTRKHTRTLLNLVVTYFDDGFTNRNCAPIAVTTTLESVSESRHIESALLPGKASGSHTKRTRVEIEPAPPLQDAPLEYMIEMLSSSIVRTDDGSPSEIFPFGVTCVNQITPSLSYF